MCCVALCWDADADVRIEALASMRAQEQAGQPQPAAEPEVPRMQAPTWRAGASSSGRVQAETPQVGGYVHGRWVVIGRVGGRGEPHTWLGTSI